MPIAFGRTTFDGALVVATDGLFSYAQHHTLVKVVEEHEDLDETAEALVRVVRLPSGTLQDDVAVVVISRARGLR